MTRPLPILLVLLGLCSAAGAQDDLQQKLDKKLDAPFLKKAAWSTDYDKALATAAESGRLLFAYFTRSYAS
jgi:hypothetical protein